MSLESALRFLEEGRHRPALQREIGLLAGDAGYDTLCAIAARYDYEFTPEELVRAFAVNWVARWAHFHRRAAKNGDQDV